MTDGFEPEEDVVPRGTTKLRQPTSFLLLVFGFGLAAGFLLAFSGYGLEDSAALVISDISDANPVGLFCWNPRISIS
ncbi:MAG: hypothetical protein Q9M48_13475 [Rhodobacterales bacterium]|nr:hypothetical protein [Rhodobacterales bacterium]